MNFSSHEPCSKASRTIFLLLGTTKSHSTYIGKLTTQKKKKSYRDFVVSDSSANVIEKPMIPLVVGNLFCPLLKGFLILKKKIQEFIRHDSPTLPEIARESLELGRQYIVGDETPTIRRIVKSLRK